MNQDSGANPALPGQLAGLRRLARPRPAAEICDLCSLEIAPEHPHLLDPATRQILCACDACAVLFSGGQDTKYKRVPWRTRMLAGFHLSDEQWESLLIPVGMAFFFYSSPAGRMVAYYPSPAGATESLLELEAWEEIAAANPALAAMQPDVEALLVNRVGRAREYYIAPIDKCYELVGLLRLNWRGLAGGAEVWREIGAFFDRLRSNAEVVDEGTPAPPEPEPAPAPARGWRQMRDKQRTATGEGASGDA